MASDSEDDSFVTIGTALPTYAEDEVPKKQSSYKEQAVKDERGRPQRFHGAFTGGFSAGYYNSVGSKEGWTPSTFVSSREKKLESFGSRPEDFMDDEDFMAYGIAPKQISTTDKFRSGTDGNNKPSAAPSGGVIPGIAPLEGIVSAASTSAGAKLMQKLGWKEGQGVGPRVKRKKKRSGKPGQRVYGCALPPTGSDEESDDEYAEGLTFAPKDVNPISFTPKDNHHGIGYSGINMASGLSSGHVNFFEPPPSTKSKAGKQGMRGHAFGVGALEDDDDDIYAQDSMANYDFALGGKKGRDTYGWTAPQEPGLPQNLATIGRLLQGFKLCDKVLRPKKVYPPPVLPRNFKPCHQSEKDKMNQQTGDKNDREQSSSVRRMDAKKRGIILGEKPDIRSVFDLVNDADKNRLKTSTTSPSSDQPGSHQERKSHFDVKDRSEPSKTSKDIKSSASSSGRKSRFDMKERPERKSVSTETSKNESSNVSKPAFGAASWSGWGGGGFKPFVNNPAKQERYDQYLEFLKKHPTDAYGKLDTVDLTEWERDREREEFARSAQLFRPMASMFASRFTSAKHRDDEENVHIPAKEEEKSEEAKAVEMKMFGRLTHTEHEWHPDKLLCKRFNVANPYPDSSSVGVPTVKRSKFSVFDFLMTPPPQAPTLAPPAGPPPALEAPPPGSTDDREGYNLNQSTDQSTTPTDQVVPQVSPAENLTASQTVKETVTQEEEAEEPTKPSMDLFKAIFSNSESSSSEEEKEDEEDAAGEVQDNTETGKADQQIAQPILEPPSLQPRSPDHPPPQAVRDPLWERLEAEGVNNITAATTDTAMSYGPSLPPGFADTPGDRPGEDAEMDGGSKSSSKKHKHKDKHKHKKKKSKHKKEKHKKKKKRKKKEVASSSSSDEADSEGSSGSDVEVISKQDFHRRMKSSSLHKRPTASDFM